MMLWRRKADRNPIQNLFGVACIALLLVVTSVQAAHFCDLVIAVSTQQQVRAETSASNGTLACAICASAHGAPLAKFNPALTPDLVAPDWVTAARSRTPRFVSFFALYIRPPPALP